jgi:hypothetical protein
VLVLSEGVARHPANAPAKLVLGSLKLDAKDASGVALVEEAMRLDPLLTVDATHRLIEHYVGVGDATTAARHAEKKHQFAATLELAAEERQTLSADTALEPHDLSKQQLGLLETRLRGVKNFEEALLLKRKLTHISERPQYVLWVRFSHSIFQGSEERARTAQNEHTRLSERLAFLGDVLLFLGASAEMPNSVNATLLARGTRIRHGKSKQVAPNLKAPDRSSRSSADQVR